MKRIVRKSIAGIAIILGLMSAMVGTSVLIGLFDPGYQTFPILIYYNVIMGVVSVIAGMLIGTGHKQARHLSGFITIGHISVLIILHTIFNDIIASQSIQAMIFRSVIWVLIMAALISTKPKKQEIK